MDQKKPLVLMFCTGFFGYDKRIASALREEGFLVDLFDERAGTGFFSKACIRFNLRFYRPAVRRYVKNIIRKSESKKYDYVFVVKGEGINEEAVSLLRQAYPEAKFILYLWDSVENIPDCAKRMTLYDRVFTFDPQDAEKYSLIFRPLFFCEEYENRDKSQMDLGFEYDFAFIGTAHSERPKITKILAAERESAGKQSFAFFYLPHPLIYVYNKIFNPAYRSVKKSEISFSPISADEIRSVYDKSRCVLDVEHSKQRGLTMRTVELLGLRKKIITTNALVKDYDFYHPDNIYVIDRKNPVVEESFWASEYKAIPDEIQRKYSLREFIREVFNLKEKDNHE